MRSNSKFSVFYRIPCFADVSLRAEEEKRAMKGIGQVICDSVITKRHGKSNKSIYSLLRFSSAICPISLLHLGWFSLPSLSKPQESESERWWRSRRVPRARVIEKEVLGEYITTNFGMETRWRFWPHLNVSRFWNEEVILLSCHLGMSSLMARQKLLKHCASNIVAIV